MVEDVDPSAAHFLTGVRPALPALVGAQYDEDGGIDLVDRLVRIIALVVLGR